jgi:precorrin-6B methylase 2
LSGAPVQVEGMPRCRRPIRLSVLQKAAPRPAPVVWEVVDATGMALTLALHSGRRYGAAPMPVYKRVYRLGSETLR